jgi:hypothetical protein
VPRFCLSHFRPRSTTFEADWAEAGAEVILRRCPICSRDSIIGHGRRRKQAHDEHHDWIGIRRGLCNRCGKTFTFLPPFSPPYGHYSFIARSQALQRYFLEGRCWEAAAPTVKDPDRVADPSTLRRWFRNLDSSHPPFSALRRTMLAISAWLSRTELLVHNSLPLRRHTAFTVSRPLLAVADLEKIAPPTILAWEDGWLSAYSRLRWRKQHHGRESGAA